MSETKCEIVENLGPEHTLILRVAFCELECAFVRDIPCLTYVIGLLVLCETSSFRRVLLNDGALHI